jgi:carboxymethylenebutenolidase
MTEKISFKSRDGKDCEGALARAKAGDKAPAIVVIQEWWGVNEQIKGMCERFAAEGFNALAPDLYHGKVVDLEKSEEANHAMASLDWPRAIEEIAGAIAHLRAHSSGKVAVTGFCMGGALSFVTATAVPGLAAVIPFYGVPPGGDWSKVDAPIQAHTGSHDDWASPAKMEEILKQVKPAHELHVYDAQHAFMNEQRAEVYSPDSAKLAWERALAFLRKHAA